MTPEDFNTTPTPGYVSDCCGTSYKVDKRAEERTCDACDDACEAIPEDEYFVDGRVGEASEQGEAWSGGFAANH